MYQRMFFDGLLLVTFYMMKQSTDLLGVSVDLSIR